MTATAQSILVVDSDPATVEAIRIALHAADAGAEVHGAGSLAEYRAALLERLPDFVIMGLKLPDGRAVEALPRRDGPNPFPILVMADHGEEEAARAAVRAGALDYLVKSPEPFADLPHVVAHGLHMWRLDQERHRATAALHTSEELFRLAMEAVQDGVWDWHLDTDEAYYSPSCSRMLGCEPGALPPTVSAWLDLVHPEDSERALAAIHDCFENRADRFEVELRARERSGEWRWILARGSAVARDVGGRATRVVGTHSDITERKRAEEALRASEERFRALFSQAGDGIELVDEEGHFLDVNAAGCRQLGYTREELLQLHVPSIDQLVDRETFLARGSQLVENVPTTFESVHRRKDGTEFPVEITITALKLQGEVRYLTLARDVTERKRAEQALRESEERHRTILHTAMDGFWLTDAQGRLLQVNDAYCRMSGYSADELLTMTISDLEAEESAEVVAAHIANVMRDGQDRFESRHRRRNGSVYEVEVSVQSRAVNGGQLVVFLRDITERKQVEERLRQAEKMEAVGLLAGGVAHDFNNMLGGIMGYADMILEHSRDPGVRRYAANVISAAERSAGLTEKLLAFARKGRYQVVQVDLNDLVDEVVGLLERTIDRRITIGRRFTAQPALVSGDKAQLQNALLNLALNARDAMADGGELVFYTSTMDVDDTLRSTFPFEMTTGRYVRVDVSDTGCGLSEEARRHLFEPFFTTKGPHRGTGLGLPSVYGTVKSHGGAITFDSLEGRGTVFHVYLPAITEESSEAPEERPEAQPGKRARLLLVEDEDALRDMVGDMLTRLGHDVSLARNGVEAVELYREYWHTVDLVILDMVMPVMGGRDAFHELRRLNPQARVLFLSGYSEDGEAQALLAEGAVGFMSKPFRRAELARQVEAALAHRPSGT